MYADKVSCCAALDYGFTGRLAPRARTRLLALGTPARFARRTHLLREGDRSTHLLLITQGRVKVTRVAANGYAVVLAIRGPGDLVGEMSSLDGGTRSATVTALDPVTALVIAAAAFHHFIDEEQGAGLALAELMACRLRASDRQRLEFAAFPVQRRLSLILLELERWYGVSAADDPAHRDIDLALSQPDLAGLVGASLDSIAKAIQDLARRGSYGTVGAASRSSTGRRWQKSRARFRDISREAVIFPVSVAAAVLNCSTAAGTGRRGRPRPSMIQLEGRCDDAGSSTAFPGRRGHRGVRSQR